jgi:hypothetical protein
VHPLLVIIAQNSDTKLNYNTSSESRLVPCGQTERNDESYSRFSQFCESASKVVKKFTVFLFSALGSQVTNEMANSRSASVYMETESEVLSNTSVIWRLMTSRS